MADVKKLFVVRKYVMARSAAEALRLEKKQSSDDVWLDDDWKKSNLPEATKAFGIVVRPTKRRRLR
jgi:hypothetical protein